MLLFSKGEEGNREECAGEGGRPGKCAPEFHKCMGMNEFQIVVKLKVLL